MKARAAKYVDGFVLPVPIKNLQKYKRLSRLAGKVFREHGALEYKESVGDDLNIKGMKSFSAMAKAKPGETVFFSYIVYKSKSHRNKVNAKVMKDPRLAMMMNPKEIPFDVKRMAYGGFKIAVGI